MDVGVSAGQREERGDVTKEMVNFIGEERQVKDIERVTGRKARDLQTEEIACKCQTFLSLLSSKRKQTSDVFLLYRNLKGGFS